MTDTNEEVASLISKNTHLSTTIHLGKSIQPDDALPIVKKTIGDSTARNLIDFSLLAGKIEKFKRDQLSTDGSIAYSRKLLEKMVESDGAIFPTAPGKNLKSIILQERYFDFLEMEQSFDIQKSSSHKWSILEEVTWDRVISSYVPYGCIWRRIFPVREPASRTDSTFKNDPASGIISSDLGTLRLVDSNDRPRLHRPQNEGDTEQQRIARENAELVRISRPRRGNVVNYTDMELDDKTGTGKRLKLMTAVLAQFDKLHTPEEDDKSISEEENRHVKLNRIIMAHFATPKNALKNKLRSGKLHFSTDEVESFGLKEEDRGKVYSMYDANGYEAHFIIVQPTYKSIIGNIFTMMGSIGAIQAINEATKKRIEATNTAIGLLYKKTYETDRTTEDSNESEEEYDEDAALKAEISDDDEDAIKKKKKEDAEYEDDGDEGEE